MTDIMGTTVTTEGFDTSVFESMDKAFINLDNQHDHYLDYVLDTLRFSTFEFKGAYSAVQHERYVFTHPSTDYVYHVSHHQDARCVTLNITKSEYVIKRMLKHFTKETTW